MPNEQRVWGVLFTNAGLSELRDVLEPYLSTGSIGPYLYCKQVDMGNPYLGACPRKKSLKNNVLELRRGDLKISPFPETRVLTGDQNFLIFSKNT